MREAHLKPSFIEKRDVVDQSTGEILTSEVKQFNYLASTKEGFFLAYAGLLGIFMSMSQAEIRTFGYCLRFRNAKFDITKRLRISMGDEIDLNERTIANTIPLLVSKNLLVKHTDGLYQVNPRYAYHGSSSDRNNELRLILELGLEA